MRHSLMRNLVLFPPEGATFCQSRPPSCGLAQHHGTWHTQNNCLSMAEHSCDLVAAWTFDIHKVAVWTLHKTLEFVLPFFFLHRGMQKIFEQLEMNNTKLSYLMSRKWFITTYTNAIFKDDYIFPGTQDDFTLTTMHSWFLN